MPNPDVHSHSQEIRKFAYSMRIFLRDFKELNRLVEGEESDERMIMWAVIDTILDFNDSPPPIGQFDIFSIPKAVLRYGTVARILQSVGILQMRNHINFSDGGISIGISDKSPALQRWASIFENQYENKKDRWKYYFYQ